MKLLCLCSLLCCSLSSLPSFAQDPSLKYIVNGEVSSLKDGDKVYLIYQVGDKQITDSSIVKGYKFSFRAALDNPVFAALYLNRNPYSRRMLPGEVLDYKRFYLEPSTIAITASDSLKHAKISGSQTDLLNNQLQGRLKENNDQFDNLRKEFEKLPQDKQKDTAIFQSFVKREKQLMEDSYETHLAFANEHPKDYISVISLSHIAAQPSVTARSAQAYNRLSQPLKQTPLGKGIVVQLSATENTGIGKLAPEFEQSTAEGTNVKLSDFRNKYVLIDFWASWCGPCRDENPNVVKAYSLYKNKNFTVIGVSLDGPGQREAWIKAIKDDGLAWTQVSDLKGWENDAAKIYGVRSIPVNFLVGPDGKIMGKNLRGDALIAELKKLLTK